MLAGGTQSQRGMILCKPFFFLLLDSVFGLALSAWAGVSFDVALLAAPGDDCAVEVPLCEVVEEAVAGAAAAAGAGAGAGESLPTTAAVGLGTGSAGAFSSPGAAAGGAGDLSLIHISEPTRP